MKLFTTFLGCLVILITTSLHSQTNPNKTMTNQETVQKFLEGFNDPTMIQESLALLSDDYHFKNPMVELTTKSAFMELAKQIGSILTGVDILHITENGDWIAAMYEFKSSIAGLEVNLATEWFRLENGIIKESILIYDASKWRALYAQMEN